MQKIVWKRDKDCFAARVGCVHLGCWSYAEMGHKRFWKGVVSFRQRGGTYRHANKKRSSLAKAKEDAIQLAREMLSDYQTSLTKELKNFDMEFVDGCLLE